MKKNIYLLRHAQADEKMSEEADLDRALNATGLQNATKMGINFHKKAVVFDIIISSPAVRALATATLVAEQVKYDSNRIHQNSEIYEACIRTLLKVVNQLKEEWSTVLLVGHNPSITYLAEYISKAEIGNMTTCGVAQLSFDNMTWEEISEGNGHLTSYEYTSLLNF